MTLNPARLLKRHYSAVWACVTVLAMLPLGALCFGLSQGTLGINPLERLNHGTGRWALNLLVVTLALTPLRRLLAFAMAQSSCDFGKRLSDWNALIRLRRTFGVLSFVYAALHVAIYLCLEQDWNVRAALAEVTGKRYLAAGTLAFVLMVPLAASSTRAMMRRLGGNWKRLHRAVYVIAAAACLHWLWLEKVGVDAPVYYAALIGALLGYRALARFDVLFRRPRDDGDEVAERTADILKTGQEHTDIRMQRGSQSTTCESSQER
jgi:sulfoxide reductase heme-binding subunit YedZ